MVDILAFHSTMWIIALRSIHTHRIGGFMRTPPKGTAVGTLTRYGRFTLGRLLSKPQARKLIPTFKPTHLRLKATQAKVNDAEDLHIDAVAAFEGVRTEAAEALTHLQL